MTPDDFIQLVERVAPGAQARAVLETTQFRAGGKTFATLGWPAEGWAIIKLTAPEQRRALAVSDAFAREPGRPRNSGVTLVRLKGVDALLLSDLIASAWRHAAPPPKARLSRPASQGLSALA